MTSNEGSGSGDGRYAIGMVPSTTVHRSATSDTYDGPFIAARGQGVDDRRVWVANGTRPRADVFRAPGPVTALRRQLLASPRIEDGSKVRGGHDDLQRSDALGQLMTLGAGGRMGAPSVQVCD